MREGKVGEWGTSKALRLTEELNELEVDVGEEVEVVVKELKLTGEKYIVIFSKEKNERG